jgi:serine/threonine-protein kinase
MATIHLGRLVGPVGFSRMVAIKRLHEHLAHDPEFVQMFLDEARIAARIQHPNVVSTIDIVELDNELFLVMDYIQGESLSYFIKRARNHDQRVPPNIAVHVMVGVLHGLHAAHEARDEKGQPLGIIHRDVTPHNVLIGVDGVPRIADFGIATAAGRLHQTREGQIKGKVQYMAPEQLTSKPTDRRCDIYAASVVLWESITGQRLFSAHTDAQIMYKVLETSAERPSSIVKGLPIGLDAVILKGLQKDPGKRYSTAEEMAIALEKILPPVTTSVVGAWVREQAAEPLANAAIHIQEAERTSPNERALAIAHLARVQAPPAATSSEVNPPEQPSAEAKAPPAPLAPPVQSVPPVPGEVSAEFFLEPLDELPPPGVAAPLNGPPLEAPGPPPRRDTSTTASPHDLPEETRSVLDASMAVSDDTLAEESFPPAPRKAPHQKLVLGVISGAGLLLLGGLFLKNSSTEEPSAEVNRPPMSSASVALRPTVAPPTERVQPDPAELAPALVSAQVAPSSSSAPATSSASASPSVSAPTNKPKKPKNKLYSRD